ncbi:hypothetical protein DB32_005672 [Sandaracinus amylolyticus]|uniref:Uncharacterized protein n=1 Tax=Sandaracinus amylolyticus TaxID=927083 RepID=A0A0F6W6A4_9BACT|nr:hypothetical protein DB32_005672 [Sandaracinus amylolyticus]
MLRPRRPDERGPDCRRGPLRAQSPRNAEFRRVRGRVAIRGFAARDARATWRLRLADRAGSDIGFRCAQGLGGRALPRAVRPGGLAALFLFPGAVRPRTPSCARGPSPLAISRGGRLVGDGARGAPPDPELRAGPQPACDLARRSARRGRCAGCAPVPRAAPRAISRVADSGRRRSNVVVVVVVVGSARRIDARSPRARLRAA